MISSPALVPDGGWSTEPALTPSSSRVTVRMPARCGIESGLAPELWNPHSFGAAVVDPVPGRAAAATSTLATTTPAIRNRRIRVAQFAFGR